MTRKILFVAALLPISAALAGAIAAPTIDAGTLSGLGIRNIGSADDERPHRVAGRDRTCRTASSTIYVGAASGGVWKSLDGGTTFEPVFDHQPVQSIGAVTIDPRNPDTVWVGTGEAWTRNSVSIGDGIYKTTDGGDTWKNVGLPGSERIVDVCIDPRNSSDGLRLRHRPAVERLRGARRLQDDRRRHDLAARAQGRRTSPPAAPASASTSRTRTSCTRRCGTSVARAGPSARAASRPPRRRAAR